MTSAKVLAKLKKLAGGGDDEPKKKPVVAAPTHSAPPKKGSRWSEVVDDEDDSDAESSDDDDDDDDDEEPAKTAVRPLVDGSGEDDAAFVERCVELLCEVVDFIAENRDKLHRLIQN